MGEAKLKAEHKRTEEEVDAMAHAIDVAINGTASGLIVERKNGFVLLVFPFDAPEGYRVNYVSNAQRDTVIKSLKEIVARFEEKAVEDARGTAH